jgi:hypothetical protein
VGGGLDSARSGELGGQRFRHITEEVLMRFWVLGGCGQGSWVVVFQDFAEKLLGHNQREQRREIMRGTKEVLGGVHVQHTHQYTH